MCSMSLPSCVNLSRCESMVPAGGGGGGGGIGGGGEGGWVESLGQVPLPPIQTLSLWSMEIPWLDEGQTYPVPGPPQEFTRLPSGSNSRMGGAAAQHSAMGGVRAAPASVRWLSVGSPRWMMNTSSLQSTPPPI